MGLLNSKKHATCSYTFKEQVACYHLYFEASYTVTLLFLVLRFPLLPIFAALQAQLKSFHNKFLDTIQIFDIHFLKTASESLFSKAVLPLLRIPFSFIIHSFLAFLLHHERLINFATFYKAHYLDLHILSRTNDPTIV